MLIKSHRRTAAVAVAALTLFGTAACSSSDGDAKDTSTTTEAPATTQTPDETTTTAGGEKTTTTAANGSEGTDGELAAFAKEYKTEGELLTTLEADGFKLDIYQVGTQPAPKDGNFVDPDTNEPILKKGDEMVYVNYVFTNTSGKDIQLGASLVAVTATYADWKWAQGMDGVSSSSEYEKLGLFSSGAKTGADWPVVWKAGSSFAYADNFKYRAGDEITFKARMTPSDDDGDLVHDKKVEDEVTTKIK